VIATPWLGGGTGIDLITVSSPASGRKGARKPFQTRWRKILEQITSKCGFNQKERKQKMEARLGQ
jgi:hypothetical protein